LNLMILPSLPSRPSAKCHVHNNFEQSSGVRPTGIIPPLASLTVSRTWATLKSHP
jgi:hypothetical protein